VAVVRVMPAGIDIAVAAGETLFEAASRQGYAWPTRCCGQAQCMLCALEIEDGVDNAVAPEREEQEAIRRIQSLHPMVRDCRLACRMKAAGPLVVRKEGVRRA
jgi:ferredoxin, 2Fe-2S